MSPAVVEKLLRFEVSEKFVPWDALCLGVTESPTHSAQVRFPNTFNGLISFHNDVLINFRDSFSGTILSQPGFPAESMYMVGLPTVTVDGSEIVIEIGYTPVTTSDYENL